jgi:hypothetical protein
MSEPFEIVGEGSPFAERKPYSRAVLGLALPGATVMMSFFIDGDPGWSSETAYTLITSGKMSWLTQRRLGPSRRAPVPGKSGTGAGRWPLGCAGEASGRFDAKHDLGQPSCLRRSSGLHGTASEQVLPLCYPIRWDGP